MPGEERDTALDEARTWKSYHSAAERNWQQQSERAEKAEREAAEARELLREVLDRGTLSDSWIERTRAALSNPPTSEEPSDG